jgi:hypothetical protein
MVMTVGTKGATFALPADIIDVDAESPHYQVIGQS